MFQYRYNRVPGLPRINKLNNMNKFVVIKGVDGYRESISKKTQVTYEEINNLRRLSALLDPGVVYKDVLTLEQYEFFNEYVPQYSGGTDTIESVTLTVEEKLV